MTDEELIYLWNRHAFQAKVEKIGGRYGGPGFLRQIVPLRDGKLSAVVAHRIEGGYGEFLHIYTPTQLEDVSDEARDRRNNNQ